MTNLPPANPARSAIPRPRLVLRVGFAGKREFWKSKPDQERPSDDEIQRLGAPIQEKLREVFRVIGQELIEVAPHTPCQRGLAPAISAFYAQQDPLLRVITGLCEGADTLAFHAAGNIGLGCLEVENAAVIGFPIESYRSSRESDFLDEFDRQVSQSAFILVGDGIYDPTRETDPNATEEARNLAKMRRNRGFRCQSDLLLRQSDLLVALVDPSDEGKAGGTLETIHKALALQIPVVIVNPKNLGVSLHSPEVNLADAIEAGADPDWQATLESRVRRIVANPVISEDAFQNEQSSHSSAILEEFFSGSLPQEWNGNRMISWERFASWFKNPEAAKTQRAAETYQIPQTDAFLGKDGYRNYRNWASQLADRYSKRFREAMFQNALFALAAVFLAVASLLLLARVHGSPHTAEIVTLICLASAKLYLVVRIFLSAHQANHDHWNDRLVDYRYFSERMRAMLYLPDVGSWQPPAAATPQYASRVIRQSAVDWLLDAIIRSLSPAAWCETNDPQRRILLKPAEDQGETPSTLKRMTASWLQGQFGYHKKNALQMQRMERWLRALGELLNALVMLIVAFDIILLVVKLVVHMHSIKDHHTAKTISEWLEDAAPFIVFVTAILPAAVAAVNVIRLQSECERLAERSAVMMRLLGGRRESDPESKPRHAADHAPHPGWLRGFLTSMKQNLETLRHPRGAAESSPPAKPAEGGKIQEAEDLLALLHSDPERELGATCGKTLHFTEDCAKIFVQEIAEWSVLYAKELVEP